MLDTTHTHIHKHTHTHTHTHTHSQTHTHTHIHTLKHTHIHTHTLGVQMLLSVQEPGWAWTVLGVGRDQQLSILQQEAVTFQSLRYL